VPSALSRRAQEAARKKWLTQFVRQQAPTYAVIRVAGQPAIAFAAHSGRIIKVVSDSELTEIERAMNET
jgi:hypothetical protein